VPRVSVLLPYRDAEATLDEAMESVRRQTFDDLEIVAIDDGSRDGGPALVAHHARLDPRVRSLRLPAGRGGIPQALDFGFGAARGRFIARMDADDVSLPARFELQWAALEAAPDLGVIGTQVEGFPDILEGLARYIDWQNGLITATEHARELFVESPLCHPSVMMRREALEAVSGFRDPEWAEDYDLWLRMAAAGWGLAKVPEVLFRWRHRADRATLKDERYARERFTRAKAHYLAPRLREDRRSLVIWGAGTTGRRFARALEAHHVTPAVFVDIDPRKIGGVARDRPIVATSHLDGGPGAHVVLVAVGARGARALVRERLTRLGFVEGDDFVCVA
jgi:glycosyltransferase involved in cell wall biosynthesis